MKKFSHDWFSQNINTWNIYLSHYKHQENLKFLEIGSFEGLSCCWIIDNILTKDSSKIYCIDTFAGSYEHQPGGTSEFNFTNVENTFRHNTSEYGEKVVVCKGFSSYYLNHQIIKNNKYDFIYIDGCHESKEVLQDAVLSFDILKHEGIMIFDDYLWGDWQEYPSMTPKISVDSFIACYKKYIEVLHMGYQVIIKKIGE